MATIPVLESHFPTFRSSHEDHFPWALDLLTQNRFERLQGIISLPTQPSPLELPKRIYSPRVIACVQQKYYFLHCLACQSQSSLIQCSVLFRIIADALLGILLCGIIRWTQLLLAPSMQHVILYWGIDYIEEMFVWFKAWPAGLKLNKPYAQFLGELFVWFLRGWSFIALSPLIQSSKYLVEMISGLSVVLGGSFAVCITLDWINVGFFHIYVLHLTMSRLFDWQVSVLSALFSLFWGKKRNPLRKRVDSGEFAVDQLLLGTILFTILLFLFPTTAIYRLFLEMVRLFLLM
jgi:hypothetical protein